MPTNEIWKPTARKGAGTMTSRQMFRANFFGTDHHRPDGSRLTVKSISARRADRRVRNRVARASRKANR